MQQPMGDLLDAFIFNWFACDAMPTTQVITQPPPSNDTNNGAG